jgi:hypothetical protein
MTQVSDVTPWPLESSPIRRSPPFSRLLRHTRWCGWLILTWILTGPHLVVFYDMQGDAEVLLLPGSSRLRSLFSCPLRHTRAYWGPIRTWIFMDPHSVASYDTQGGGADLFLSETSQIPIRYARGLGGPILTRILTGPNSVASYDIQGMPRTYSN